MRVIVVTGGGNDAAPAIADLVASLTPARKTISFAIGCLDLGLSEATRTGLTTEIDTFVAPAWPYQETAPPLGAAHAEAIPPFLPTLFPGFDAYLWIAPHAFIQTPAAISLLSRACAGGLAGVIPAIDRSYDHRPHDQQALLERYRKAFGHETAQRMAGPYVTANVVAAAAGSPLWPVWQQSYRLALKNGGAAQLSSLAPLNHALRSADIPHHRLPAVCNWQSHLASPQIDFARGGLVEPSYPFDPLWIVANSFADTTAERELIRRDGGTLRCALTFQSLRQALRAHRGVSS